jgi:hypothetical protein
MNIKELKELIKDLPDDLVVFISHEDAAHPEAVTDYLLNFNSWHTNKKDALLLSFKEDSNW